MLSLKRDCFYFSPGPAHVINTCCRRNSFRIVSACMKFGQITGLPLRAAFAATMAVSPAMANCFGPETIARAPFEVIAQAPPPPADGATNYSHYPLTAAATMNLGALQRSESSVGKYWFLWANRCHDLGFNAGTCGWNKKGNFVFPRIRAGERDIRPFFSSFAAANGCTLIQAAHALGHADADIRDRAAQARVTLTTEGAPELEKGNLVDVCILPAQRLPRDASGIVLDYEVQDGRKPEETRRFLEQFADLVHAAGKQAILFTNPLDAPTQRYTGIDASNANAVLRKFDRVGMMLWSRNRQQNLLESLSSQMALLRAGGDVDPGRLLIVFELQGTTLDDARKVHEIVRNEGFSGVMLWRNYAEVGGACDTASNRKIACLVFGSCSP